MWVAITILLLLGFLVLYSCLKVSKDADEFEARLFKKYMEEREKERGDTECLEAIL